MGPGTAAQTTVSFFDLKCEPARQSAVRVLALINRMPTEVSISVACAISTKVAQFCGLARRESRFAKPVQLGGRLADDPYECIARGALCGHLSLVDRVGGARDKSPLPDEK